MKEDEGLEGREVTARTGVDSKNHRREKVKNTIKSF